MTHNISEGRMRTNQTVSVARFITNHIRFGKKSHAQIAKKLGFDSPAIIKQWESGAVKVPINMAKPLAEAIGGEPVAFFEVLLAEYMPETWALFREVLGEAALSDYEMEVMRAYRTLAEGKDLGVIIVPAIPHIEVQPPK
jgi:transcriptional regulator with XRE-family HTH domain